MTIILKNKETLIYDDFNFKCCIGKRGLTKSKLEGDKRTPKGIFTLGPVFYRKDKYKNLETKLKKVPILKKMGWCDDPLHKKYNKLIRINKKFSYEKLYRHDYKYDLLIPINYNSKNIKPNLGSAIFIHLTKKFTPTLGCIALKKADFLILIKLINNKTKIKIL
tara:strand:- start:561 stop:1052 length:492 start_codon:yes stop_codon:yes gene_type:complete